MIAEAWDAAGLYQVGSFVGDSWKEWNGRFRDDVRDFVRGDDGSVSPRRGPVSRQPRYLWPRSSAKRNRASTSSPATTASLSTTWSLTTRSTTRRTAKPIATGRTTTAVGTAASRARPTDPAIEELRNRQVKNFLTVTMLSLGMPMIVMGDEVRRTQHGNNNAYCQDNEISWFDWTLLEKHADIRRFVKLLIDRRLLRDIGQRTQRVSLNRWLRGNQGLARRKTRSARLERLLAQPGARLEPSRKRSACSSHLECILGAARLRTADNSKQS